MIIGLSQEEMERQLIEAFNDKYIMYRQSYISQNSDGSYITTKKPDHNYLLTDEIIKLHLKQEKTIGIFSNPFSSKFICLDLDMEDASEKERQYNVNNIIGSITKVGISKDYVIVVFSANKGYHIYVHFDDLVDNERIFMFYDYILFDSGLNSNVLEIRPLPTQGIKLPLGLHRKSNKKSYYVDDAFTEITDPLFVTKIKQFPSWLFRKIAMESKVDKNKTKEYRDNLKYKQMSPKGIGVLTNDEIKDIEINGMRQKSTRNLCITQLAQYYRNLGMSENEAIAKLDDWIQRQDKKFYSSSLQFCFKENRKIVKWAYKRTPSLIKSVARFGKVKLYKNETSKLSLIENKYSKLVFVAMLIHFKIYSDKDTGNFYMTYEQIMNHTGVGNRNNISKAIKDLEKLGMIEIVFHGNYKHRISNVYKMDSGSRYIDYILDINIDSKYIECYNEYASIRLNK